ncbi:alpha/beta hydrolase [Paenibacillus sp. MMS20-IR301]|uniref:alpha/beta hydrolase n=1 Tax=Paenibacillus sp. MMS20-IR301 TaxID=2895946 RepID=UPI0028E673C6|nr:alpha/beta hydrolase [Paenibacillus sp. MMS20-IR301]WNS46085.1 alpha/beta hydrolase [Paenibacillus sp. MMS20-IR301]
MRLYKKELVDALQEQQKAADHGGIKLIEKVNPEEPGPGLIDPYELAIITKHWVGKEEGPGAGNSSATESPELALQTMRDNMGFPNRNLNTVEIHTRYEQLNFEGNEVGLWRYYPRKSMRQAGKPCLIFLHGGGFIGGSIYTLEHPCRLIAELADAVVFNIDYSLAPEKKFPNGFNDCFHAVKHIYDHAEEYGIDRSKIAVGGDSAGGNLTAAVAVKDRDLGLNMVALQVLIYPLVTFINEGVEGLKWDIKAFEIAEEQRSIIEPMLGLGRPSDEGKEDVPLGGLYFSDMKDAGSTYASPLLAEHRNLPGALCVGAEFDGLRIQTEFYGKKLSEAGVPVKTIRYKGCTHAFLDRLGFVPQAEDLCIEIASALKKL